MVKDNNELSTRERLLDAAGRLFAEKGFDAASIRDICEKAEANIASVNYHFGDKEKLYEAVVVGIFKKAEERYPVEVDGTGKIAPEERLFNFIHAVLMRRLDRDRPDWQDRIIFHEIMEPRPIFKEMVNGMIEKNSRILLSILKSMVSPEVDDKNLYLCMGSVIGQCIFYHKWAPFAFPVLRYIDFSPEGIRELAKHITEFSIAAIGKISESANAQKPGTKERIDK